MRGDFGESLYYDVPSLRLVRERVPNTLRLGGVAFIVAIFIGVPLGVISAVRRGSIADYGVRGFALLGQSVPVFLDRHHDDPHILPRNSDGCRRVGTRAGTTTSCRR